MVLGFPGCESEAQRRGAAVCQTVAGRRILAEAQSAFGIYFGNEIHTIHLYGCPRQCMELRNCTHHEEGLGNCAVKIWTILDGCTTEDSARTYIDTTFSSFRIV